MNIRNGNIVVSGSGLFNGAVTSSFTGSFTGSLLGTASWAINALTASFALNAGGSTVNTGSFLITASAVNTTITFTKGDGTTFDVTVSQSGSVATASYALYAETASYVTTAQTASYWSGSVTNALSSSFASTASFWSGSIINAQSASYASTASYWSGSIINAETASYWSGSITNALSASYAETASYWSGSIVNTLSASYAETASFWSGSIINALSASYAATASFWSGSITNALSASFAATASSADNFTVRGTLTAQTIVVQTITSSTDFVTGSTRFGSDLTNTHTFTGSVSITGSLTLPTLTQGSVVFAGSGGTLSQDNSNFFWDNTNKRLGIGTNAPSYSLHLAGSRFLQSGTASTAATTLYHVIDTNAVANSSYILFGIDINGSTVGFGTQAGAYMSVGKNGTGTARALILHNYDAQPIIFANNNTARLQIFGSTGNVLIQNGGTFTDAGYRLDVSGSARITNNTKIGNTVYADPASNLITGIDSGSNAARGAIANASNYQDFFFVNTSVSSGNVNFWSFGQRRDTAFGNALGSFQIVGGYVDNSGNVATVGGGYRVPLIANPNGDLILAGASGSAVNGNVGIGTTSPSFKLDVSGSTRFNGNSIVTGSFTVVTGSSVEFQVTNTGVKIGNIITDTHTITGSLNVSGSVTATNFTGSLFGTASWATNALTASLATTALTASSADNFIVRNNLTASAVLISGSGTNRLTVIGSGSAQPIFTVQGSQGELFSITDSLSGSLFSVNDISGLPILEVFSDSTTLMGNYLAPSLNTTSKITTTNSGSFVIYSVPTSSYDGIFVDYVAKSGSAARAGTVVALWSGSAANWMDNSTTDFGDTSQLVFSAIVSGSNLVVTGSVATGSGWIIKSIIRSI